MARAGILQSHVELAAERLTAKGVNPTVDGVREELGGTGSKSTIGPMLKSWKEKQARTADVPPLPAALIQAVQTLYQDMLDKNALTLSAAEQKFLELSALETRKTEALRAEMGVLTSEYESLKGEAASTQAKLSDALELNRLLEVAVAEKVVECSGLEHRVADKHAEVTSLKSQLTQAGKQFEHLEKAHATQREGERQGFQIRISHLEQGAEIASTKLSRNEAQILDLQRQANATAASNHSLQVDLSIARANYENALQNVQSHKEVILELTAKSNEWKNRFDEASVALASTERELALANEHAARLEHQDAEHAQAKTAWAVEQALLIEQLQRIHLQTQSEGKKSPTI